MNQPISGGELFFGVGEQPPWIRVAATEVRAGWSDAEHYLKAGSPIPAWLTDEPIVTSGAITRERDEFTIPILKGL